MTVSERIFELIKERGYTQKEFSKKTGIAESTISDWKKKGTNPVSDKILIICEVLGVSPYFLLSGAENKGERSRQNQTLVVTRSSDPGELVSCYESLDEEGKKQALKYIKKLAGAGTGAGEDKEKAGSKAESEAKETLRPAAGSKPKNTDKPKDESKPKNTFVSIASDRSDSLIKDEAKDKADRKKKDKSKDKNKDKDKKKKKDKDKKKKKKGYLLDR